MTDAENIPTYQERITSISRLAFFILLLIYSTVNSNHLFVIRIPKR